MTGQRSAAGKPVSIFVYALTVKRRRRQRVLIPVGDRKLNVQLCENGAMERCAAALAVCKGGWAGRYPRDEQNVGPGSRLRRHAAGKRWWERGAFGCSGADTPRCRAHRRNGRESGLPHGECELGGSACAGSGRKPDDEVAKLRRENERLKEENEILKKAAVYFAKELP